MERGVWKRGGVGNTRLRCGSLRNRIRGIERTIQHLGSDLSAKGRARLENEKASLESLRRERRRREREREMTQRYRMVRFFERRKIERRLEREERRLQEGQGSQQTVRRLRRDLRYVREFPKGRKYVALFPKGGHTEESRKMVERIRIEIEKREAEVPSGAGQHAGKRAERGSDAEGSEGESEDGRDFDDFLVEEKDGEE